MTTMQTKEADVTETNDTPIEATPTKPKRQRRTPEQRIAEREMEILRIREQCKQRVRETIDGLLAKLREAADRATDANLPADAARIDGAIKALSGK